jgi:hypothetical protein
MMRQINAISLTHNIKEWLANSYNPRILHVFDSACNLINDDKDVLSIVALQIGNGPFNLVIDNDVLFSEHFNIESPVFIPGNQLKLGDVSISTETAKLWDPQPDWEKLHGKRDEILSRLISLRYLDYQYSIPATLQSALSTSIVLDDVPSAIGAARQHAGLGIGLTPSGDDIIMGALYAARIVHPPEVADVLSKEIAETAVPLTTSLSAAWIRSAGRGEAGVLWHEFFEALVAGTGVDIQKAIDKILATGETSGADALRGFLGTSMCWMGITRNQN